MADEDPTLTVEEMVSALLEEMDRFSALGFSLEKWNPLSCEQLLERHRNQPQKHQKKQQGTEAPAL